MITVDSRAKDFLTATEIERFLESARKGKHGVRDYLLGLMAYRHGLRVTELIRIRMDDIDLDGGRIFVRRMKGSMSVSHPMQGDEVRAIRAWLREREKWISRRRVRNRAIRGNEGEKSGANSPPSFSSASGVNLNGERTEASHSPSAEQSNAARNGDTPLEPNQSSCMELIPASGHLLFFGEGCKPFARQAINYLFAEIGKRAGLGHVHPHMLRHSCGYALANKGCDTRLIQDYLGHKDIHNTERYTRTSAARFERLWE